MKPKGKRAAIYARLSDIDGEESTSIDIQIQRCRKLASERGFTLTEADIYRENFTGTLLAERPALTQLRDQIKADRYDFVLVSRLDRISRKMSQRGIIFEELKTHGVQLLSASEDLDDSTPEGRMLISMLGAFAEFEVERTMERSADSLRHLKEKGIAICQGVARFGYRYVKATRTREIVESEAEIVRQIFRGCLEGLSTDRISEKLNDLGIPSPAATRGVKLNGSPKWFGSTIRAILRDRSYIGEPLRSGTKKRTGERSTSKVNYQGRRTTKAGRPIYVKTDPSEQWLSKEPTPPIIDRETFDAAQSSLSSNRARNRTYNERLPLLLRGYVKCAVCGKSMSCQTQHRGAKKYSYWVCNSVQLKAPCGNKGTPVEWLDALVWEFVESKLSDSTFLDRVFADSIGRGEAESFTAELEAHRAEQAKARQTIARLITAFGDDTDDTVAAVTAERIAALKKSIAAHQTEIDQLASFLAAFENREQAVRDIAGIVRTAKASLKDAPVEERRLLLEAFGVKVVAARKNIQINLSVELLGSECLPERGQHPYQQRNRISVSFTLT